MRAEGLCLRTVREQIAGGDDDPWDPEGVTVADSLFGDDRVVATLRFDRSRPLGVARVRLVNGRLWAEVDVADQHVREAEAGRFLACAGIVNRENNPRGQITGVRLTEVAFVERTTDSGQPPWEWRTESDNKAASGPAAPPPPPPASPDAPPAPAPASPLAGMPADEFER